MTTELHTTPDSPPAGTDVMPLHGIDHLELFVGNAAQAAYYYSRAFGFTETAYSGPGDGLPGPGLPRRSSRAESGSS